MNNKKVLLVCFNSSPQNRTSWSGTNYSVYQQLKQYFNVDFFVAKAKIYNSNWFSVIRDVLVSHKKPNWEFSKPVSKKLGKQIDKYLMGKSYDCLFVIGAPPMAYLKTKIPVVYFSDAVFSSMVNYYWYNFSDQGIEDGNFIQKKCLERADKIVLTSKWAKDAAIKFYNVNEDKIDIIHLGANIEVEKIIHKPHENINLLFVGVDWNRKGAQTAIDCVRYLNNMNNGKSYILHIVGCKAPYEVDDKNVIFYGFLNRDKEEDRTLLDGLREVADIYILPTKAECSSLTFAEASAYGLPSITYDTGGLSDYVINDYNGYRLPLSSTGKDFAEKVLEILKSDKLSTMQKNARELYENDLNWQTFGKKVSEVIEKVCEEKKKK